MIELEIGKRYAVSDGTHTITCECQDNEHGELGLRAVPSFCSGFFAIHDIWFDKSRIANFAEFATIKAID